MTPVLDVRVFGLPIAQGRPRAFKMPGGHVRVHDPEKSRDWKRTVLHQVLPHRPAAPLDVPLVMRLYFYLPRPKSAPKRVVYPTTKPDLSNMLKAIEDALNGIVYVDDSRLVMIEMAKLYDPVPGVRIVVEPVGP